MKRLEYFCLCLLLVLFACEPLVTFEKPQPDKTKEMVGFPRKLTGIYRNEKGNSQLLISTGTVIKLEVLEERTHPKDLDSSLALTGDFLIDLTTGEQSKVRLDGDSIVQQFEFLDTLLSLSRGDVLKKFKGYYFLNQNYGQNKWVLTSLVLKKDWLSLKAISSPEELAQLQEITDSAADSIRVFNPSKKQFRQFVMRNKDLAGDEIYFRTD